MDKLSVGILIFPGVEVLDFTGPFEVFSRTRLEPGTTSRRSEDTAPFRVFTVSTTGHEVEATGGLQVRASYTLDQFEPAGAPSAGAPGIDLLVVPGGFGTRPLLKDDRVLNWIRAQAAHTRWTTSVCTGALLLARCGLLTGRRATTHWASLDLLAEVDPTITVEREARVVRDGIVTSAGVAAGIDMAFTMVAEICGLEVAEETARYIEYPWAGPPAD